MANRIRTLIEEYRGYYPDLSGRDVRDALRTAGAGASEPGAGRRALLVALAAGIAAVVGVLFATDRSGGEPPALILPLVVGIGIIGVAIAYVVRNR